MRDVRTKIGPAGRIVIPAEFRRELGLHEGTEVVVGLDDGEVRVMTVARAIARAQELVRRHVPEARSLTDELLADRREETRRESDSS